MNEFLHTYSREERGSLLKAIREHLDRPEILTQLAEECGELTQAALKLRRVLMKKNPTPVSLPDAEKDLLDEIVDVFNCIDFLIFDAKFPAFTLEQRGTKKLERWLHRLENGCEHEEH